jgi:hypothetical protein
MSRIFPCGNESSIRQSWRRNTDGWQHGRLGCRAAADQVPCAEVWISAGLRYIYVYSSPHVHSNPACAELILGPTFREVTIAWVGKYPYTAFVKSLYDTQTNGSAERIIVCSKMTTGSATSWSLVQRSPTECDVSKVCGREASKNETA